MAWRGISAIPCPAATSASMVVKSSIRWVSPGTTPGDRRNRQQHIVDGKAAVDADPVAVGQIGHVHGGAARERRYARTITSSGSASARSRRPVARRWTRCVRPDGDDDVVDGKPGRGVAVGHVEMTGPHIDPASAARYSSSGSSSVDPDGNMPSRTVAPDRPPASLRLPGRRRR